MLRRKFLSLFFFSLLGSCQLPPALYVLNTPLGFSCSTDYDPSIGVNAEETATWLDTCANTPNTWLRFSVYADKSDTSGFLFYYETTGPSANYAYFSDLVNNHIVNRIIVPNPTNIKDFLANDSCSSTDPGGVTRGQTFPSIYLLYPTQYSVPGQAITGLNNIANRQASVIIPPLTCLGQGSFVVTTVDYINFAESKPSNILVLT